MTTDDTPADLSAFGEGSGDVARHRGVLVDQLCEHSAKLAGLGFGSVRPCGLDERAEHRQYLVVYSGDEIGFGGKVVLHQAN